MELVDDTPRSVVIDDGVSPLTTRIEVHGSLAQRSLVEAVELLADLDLSVRKAYISSDGGMFMDVFHVADRTGRKVTDTRILSCIRQSLGDGVPFSSGCTVLELTGPDRLGVLSEIFAVLTELRCRVIDAKMWTRDGGMAAFIILIDEKSSYPIEDSDKIDRIESMLGKVVRSTGEGGGARISLLPSAVADAKRRLYQMMLIDGDGQPASASLASVTSISVENCGEPDYSLVNVQCEDRPKLLFDIVCTLDLLDYVVYHGTVGTVGDHAHLEFYMRHSNGSLIRSDAERQRVIQCLQAAIECGAYKGRRLELCTVNRSGLLADVTRIFRRNGLSVTQAVISTHKQRAMNVFYLVNVIGQPADLEVMDTVHWSIESDIVKMDQSQLIFHNQQMGHDEATIQDGISFFWGTLLKRNLNDVGIIKTDDALGKIDDALCPMMVNEVLYSQSYPQVGSQSSPLKAVVPKKGSFMLPEDTFGHVVTSRGWSSCSTDTAWSFTRKFMSTEEPIFPQVSLDRAFATEVPSICCKDFDTVSFSFASTPTIEGETNNPSESMVDGEFFLSDLFSYNSLM